MKKYFLPLFQLCVAFFTQSSFAQSIPNGEFDNWTTQSRIAPNDWRILGKLTRDTSNTENYGITLYNDTTAKTSSTMYLVGNKFPDLYTGGFAINGLPTQIKVSYRSQLLANDTALFLVGFTKANDNNPVILQQFYLLPNNGSPSTDAVTTIALTNIYPLPGAIPDSGFVVISSSLRGNKPNSNGNITITDISFINTAKLNSNANLSLDQWFNTSLEEPQNWTTYLKNYYSSLSDPQNLNLSSKATYNQNSCIKLQATEVRGKRLDTLAAWAICNNTSDTPTIDKPGFAINQKPGAIKLNLYGLVKPEDQFTVIVNLFDADTLVGTATYSTKNINYINTPNIIENISWFPGYSGTPTKANIGFWLTDSTFSTQSTMGSVIYINKVEFQAYGLNTKKFKPTEAKMKIYPIPNHGNFTVEFAPNFECSQIKIFNTQGQEISHLNSEPNNNLNNKYPFNNQFTPGVYWIIATSYNGEICKLPIIIQ